MTNEKLRTLLEQLHEELEHTQAVDEKGQELLRDVSTDIRGLLGRAGNGDAEADESLLERMQSAVDYFEVTHPTITMTLSEVMTVLSNAGI